MKTITTNELADQLGVGMPLVRQRLLQKNIKPVGRIIEGKLRMNEYAYDDVKFLFSAKFKAFSTEKPFSNKMATAFIRGVYAS